MKYNQKRISKMQLIYIFRYFFLFRFFFILVIKKWKVSTKRIKNLKFENV